MTFLLANWRLFALGGAVLALVALGYQWADNAAERENLQEQVRIQSEYIKIQQENAAKERERLKALAVREAKNEKIKDEIRKESSDDAISAGQRALLERLRGDGSSE